MTTEKPIRARLVDMSIGQVEEFPKEKYEYITSMAYRLSLSGVRKYKVRNRKEEEAMFVERVS